MPRWRKYWLVLLVHQQPIMLSIRVSTYTPVEEKELSKVYAEILSNLKLTPAELTKKVDYYQEREEGLLTRQAEELKEKIKERDRVIV